MIEAVQFTATSENLAKLSEFTGRNIIFDPNAERLRIDTWEGEIIASNGDWIIKGINGELYPCKPGIFEQTYEPVAVG